MRYNLQKGAAILKRAFTLIEVLMAMVVFSILMFALMSFFSQAQKIWTGSAGRTEMFENARIALDMITRDLQCAYYVNEKTPFWHCPESANSHSQVLAFVASTQAKPNSNCVSRLVEAKYLVDKSPTESASRDPYWLKVSYTGDYKSDGSGANDKWNFYGDFNPPNAANGPFTVDSTSSGDASDAVLSVDYFGATKLIPYVLDLEFNCYDKTGTAVLNDDDSAWGTGSSESKCTKFPYSVEIRLTLLDKNNFVKWKSIGFPASGASFTNLVENNKRVFTRRVVLGDRGQY